MAYPKYRLTYNGTLSPDVMDHVISASRKNPFPVELSRFPGGMDDLFKDRTYQHTGENCMGIDYTETRQGIAWGWIAKNFGTEEKSGFLMLPDEAARQRVIEAYPDLVLRKEPFRMVLHPETVPPVKRPVGDPNRWTMADTFVFVCGMACGAMIWAMIR